MKWIISLDHWILEVGVTPPTHYLEQRFETTKFGVALFLTLSTIVLFNLGLLANLVATGWVFPVVGFNIFATIIGTAFFGYIAVDLQRTNKKAKASPAAFVKQPRHDAFASLARLMGVVTVIVLAALSFPMSSGDHLDSFTMKSIGFDDLAILTMVCMLYVVEVRRPPPKTEPERKVALAPAGA